MSGAVSLPSQEDLYQHRAHPPRHGANPVERWTGLTDAASEAGEANGRAPTTERLSASPGVRSSHEEPRRLVDPLRDISLVPSVRVKEAEFNRTVQTIDETFANVGRQLVMRDDLIDSLQQELERLRGQFAGVSGPAAQRELQERERHLHDHLQRILQRLREEQRRGKTARAEAQAELTRLQRALDASETRARQAEATADDLRRRAREDAREHHDAQQRLHTALQQARETYEAERRGVSQQLARLEASLSTAQSRNARLEEEARHSQAQLCKAEATAAHHSTQEHHQSKELALERRQREEDVDAARLSMARLLRIMSEVPALKRYLTWNEISCEFRFVGFPAPHRAAAEERVSGRREPPLAGDEATDSGADAYGVVGGAGTGVEDGVYGGRATSAQSKNLWLNATWMARLEEVLGEQNHYTRRRRTRLTDLEAAAHAVEGLPTARDVLECRQPERDYWVPYAVFVEAQRFKRAYAARLSAGTDFMPFLQRINRIWNAKLRERLRSLPRRRPGAAPVGSPEAGRLPPSLAGGRHSLARPPAWEAAADRLEAEPSPSRGLREALLLLAEVCREGAHLRVEHERLRRAVRSRVSSPRIRPLFRLYDVLLRHLLARLAAAETALAVAESSWAVDVPPPLPRAPPRLRHAATQAGGRPRPTARGLVPLAHLLRRVGEGVSDVGARLSARVLASAEDLEELFTSLREHLQGTRGEDADSTATSRSSETALRRLHRRYGGASRWDGAVGSSLTHGDGPPVDVHMLFQLIASALDFSREVREDILQAQVALEDTVQEVWARAEELGAAV